MLLTIMMIISMMMITVSGLTSTLLNTSQYVGHKIDYTYCWLIAESGLMIAPHYFEEIPIIDASFSKQDLYTQRWNGLTLDLLSVKFQLYKTETKMMSVVNEDRFRCILESNYDINNNNIVIEHITFLED